MIAPGRVMAYLGKSHVQTIEAYLDQTDQTQRNTGHYILFGGLGGAGGMQEKVNIDCQPP